MAMQYPATFERGLKKARTIEGCRFCLPPTGKNLQVATTNRSAGLYLRNRPYKYSLGQVAELPRNKHSVDIAFNAYAVAIRYISFVVCY